MACIYVLAHEAGKPTGDGCYRAVYLSQRTVKELVRSIANKCGLDAARLVRTVHINSKGLNIRVDDDVVRQLPEGQDMIMEVAEVKGEVKVEGDGNPSRVDSDLDMMQACEKPELELRLGF